MLTHLSLCFPPFCFFSSSFLSFPSLCLPFFLSFSCSFFLSSPRMFRSNPAAKHPDILFTGKRGQGKAASQLYKPTFLQPWPRGWEKALLLQWGIWLKLATANSKDLYKTDNIDEQQAFTTWSSGFENVLYYSYFYGRRQVPEDWNFSFS